MAKGKKLGAKERLEKLAVDKAERIKIFKELRLHLLSGLGIQCFPPLSHQSIEQFLKDYPEEFDRVELENTLREAESGWETIGKRQSTGDCMGNSRAWYYNMANKYGWSERSKIEADIKGSVAVSIVNYSQLD